MIDLNEQHKSSAIPRGLWVYLAVGEADPEQHLTDQGHATPSPSRPGPSHQKTHNTKPACYHCYSTKHVLGPNGQPNEYDERR